MLDLVKVARNLNDKRANVRVVAKNDDKIVIGTEFWCIEFEEPNKTPKSFQNALHKHFNVKELKEVPVNGLGSIDINKYLDGIKSNIDYSASKYGVKTIDKKDISSKTTLDNSNKMEIIKININNSNSVHLDDNIYSMIKELEDYEITATHEFGIVIFKSKYNKIGIMPVRI